MLRVVEQGQGAPSTTRCIETCRSSTRRRARACSRSGSTQHHQVH
ncbi:hypothetical protein HMPREF1550_00261 [Actinomyces sp. oral taxon 877 str. F0543]|nr:hypothetical protein HMPREF1550_00261 [Actinomyces sp. oral taxon 877 str. F0543]